LRKRVDHLLKTNQPSGFQQRFRASQMSGEPVGFRLDLKSQGKNFGEMKNRNFLFFLVSPEHRRRTAFESAFCRIILDGRKSSLRLVSILNPISDENRLRNALNQILKGENA
jgi:hypothetical protein